MLKLFKKKKAADCCHIEIKEVEPECREDSCCEDGRDKKEHACC